MALSRPGDGGMIWVQANATGAFRQFRGGNGSISALSARDSDGLLAVANTQGEIRFYQDDLAKTFAGFTNNGGVGFGNVTAMSFNADGNLVVGNNAGDLWIRQGGGSFVNVSPQQSGYGSITSIGVLAGAAGPAAAAWAVDADGNWSTATNWSPATVPNGVGAAATFGSVITAPRTVTNDFPQTVGNALFAGNLSFTVAGASTLTFDNGSTVATTLNVTNGAHSITAPVALARALRQDVSTAASVSLTNLQSSTIALTKAGDGTASLNRFRGGTLSIEAGTLRIIAGGTDTTSVIADLSIGVGATFNLAGNALVVDHQVSSGSRHVDGITLRPL